MKNFQKQPQLKNNQKKEEGNTTFPNLTPRRGSLPGDYNRPSPTKSPRTPKFPLSSPTTPRSTSPKRLNFNAFSPIQEDYEEISGVLDNLLNKQHYSDKILNKLLEEKEHEVE